MKLKKEFQVSLLSLRFFKLFFLFVVVLNAKYIEFNSKRYEYRIITSYDIIFDKKYKIKSYICCDRRFFKYEDMINFIKTGKYVSNPPYDINQIIKKRRLKNLKIKKAFKKALEEKNFKLAKEIYEKSTIKNILKTIALEMNISSCKLTFIKPDLFELIKAKRYKFFDCFIKDKKSFAKRNWVNLNKDFFRHYKIGLFDIFTKKEIDKFDISVLEKLDEKFDNEYLKGRICFNYIYWRFLRDDLKSHLNYCKYLSKNSLYYKVLFEKEKAIKELEKSYKKHYNRYVGAILVNLYLANNQKDKAKELFYDMVNKCNTFFSAINSKIIVFLIGPFFGINPFEYNLRDDCIKTISNEIYMEYEWISLFYNYKLEKF